MASLTNLLMPGSSTVDRYVMRQLALALVVSTGSLVALIWLIQSLHFIPLIVDRGMTLLGFIGLTGLLVPSFLAVVLPITTYAVIQFVYARLDTDRELVALRASGLSSFALARPALLLSLFAVLACYALNVWVMPDSFASFNKRQLAIRSSLAAYLLQDGVFTQVAPDLTVYVRARDPDGTLHGIMVDDARDKNSHATILAQRGRLLQIAGEPRVLLLDGSRQEIDKQTGRLDILTFAQNTIALAEKNTSEAYRYHDISSMSLYELYHPPTPFFARDLPKFIVEAQRRLSSPLTAGSLGLVALVTVLSGGFRRQGGMLRPVLAVVVVMALLASQLAITNLAALNLALVPLIWLQAVLPGLVCLWLLFGEAMLARHRNGLGAHAGRAAPGAASV